MLKLDTNFEGKRGSYGQVRDIFRYFGFTIGGNWNYDRGLFDGIMARDEIEGETFYLRIPFHVLKGEMDSAIALLEFETPFVIKHVVNYGLDHEDHALLSAAGFSQFQDPLDTDGQIIDKSKWKKLGEEICADILKVMASLEEQIS